MRLAALVAELPRVRAFDGGDPEICAVACDSRAVVPGALFAAVRGAKSDGHRFLEAAARAGAAACLVEDPEAPVFGMARVWVEDVEEALGRAASAFHGHPSRELSLVGITGTNGKTTTSYLVEHVFREAGIVTGRLGTVAYAFPSGEEPASLTTPDAPAFQAALARMVREGARAAVAEISSHALLRKRVEGSSFACTVFTNLTQDHLDAHGTMEEYYQAKRLLFTDHPRLVEAVVNVDDPYGRELAPDLGGHVVTYGLESGDVRCEVRRLTARSVEGIVHTPAGDFPLRLPLAGRFNAYNATAALAVAYAMGLDMARAADALSRAPQTPGRLEAVPNDLGVAAFVDYAHTPDALDRVLETVRDLTKGRVICVFGCGGDRDRAKRPLMAQAAARWADVVVLTADNSRSEDTEAILSEIEAGLPSSWRKCPPEASPQGLCYARLADRREAIAWAAGVAKSGDALVVAGKGHEATQTLGAAVLPFSDRDEVREALARRAASCA